MRTYLLFSFVFRTFSDFLRYHYPLGLKYCISNSFDFAQFLRIIISAINKLYIPFDTWDLLWFSFTDNFFFFV